MQHGIVLGLIGLVILAVSAMVGENFYPPGCDYTKERRDNLISMAIGGVGLCFVVAGVWLWLDYAVPTS